jgi:glyoxylase-like metal-dependent hydrolase (beta-lactamase superfamily II)
MSLIGVFLLLSVAVATSTAQAAGATYTKAQFAAKIVDYFGWPHPTEYNDIWKVPLGRLADLSSAHKLGKKVQVAVEQGILMPTTEGYFYPDEAISRQDAAVALAKAFKVPEASVDVVKGFADAKDVKPAARAQLNALVAAGYMAGKTATELKPNDPLTADEADAIMAKITSAVVTPVQAVPVQNAVGPRRYVKLWCPTPGATIYYTDDGSMPTTASQVYTVAAKGHFNEMLSTAQLPERDVVYRAIAVKEGLATSPAQTFTWHLYRPKIADFQSDLILKGTATSPTVYRIYNDSESVRAMAWYIEGKDRGIVFDALQTAPNVKNLKEFVEKNIAKKPFFLVIGHEHGDHNAQLMNFLGAGLEVYANKRGWNSTGLATPMGPALVSNAADQAKIKNLDEGDSLSLGNIKLDVFALPGHANGNIILQDKANGLIFASDIYGCTRAGSADNVAVQQVRADLLLSMAQQVYSGYKKDGGRTTMLFTGHDETPLNDNNLRLFEAALQQVVDKGEAGCSPTLRGKNDAPNSRTTIIGDMWKDGTDWMALKLIGIMGDKSDYLTSSPINYNGPDGYLKYSVLSNIEIEGGDLVGTTLSWRAPSDPFSWAGATAVVNNSLPNKFDPWTYAYAIKVPKSAASIAIVPTTMSTKVKSIKLDGKEIGYRSRNLVPVSDGTVIAIDVVAPDGVTTSSYKFTVAK